MSDVAREMFGDRYAGLRDADHLAADLKEARESVTHLTAVLNSPDWRIPAETGIPWADRGSVERDLAIAKERVIQIEGYLAAGHKTWIDVLVARDEEGR